MLNDEQQNFIIRSMKNNPNFRAFVDGHSGMNQDGMKDIVTWTTVFLDLKQIHNLTPFFFFFFFTDPKISIHIQFNFCLRYILDMYEYIPSSHLKKRRTKRRKVTRAEEPHFQLLRFQIRRSARWRQERPPRNLEILEMNSSWSSRGLRGCFAEFKRTFFIATEKPKGVDFSVHKAKKVEVSDLASQVSFSFPIQEWHHWSGHHQRKATAEDGNFGSSCCRGIFHGRSHPKAGWLAAIWMAGMGEETLETVNFENCWMGGSQFLMMFLLFWVLPQAGTISEPHLFMASCLRSAGNKTSSWNCTFRWSTRERRDSTAVAQSWPRPGLAALFLGDAVWNTPTTTKQDPERKPFRFHSAQNWLPCRILV